MTTRRLGRKQHQSERKRIIGHRMKLAAEQAGFATTVSAGEAMGVPNSTVSRWWNGLQVPDVDEMARYADLTGKRAWWFYMDSNDGEFELVADTLRDVVGLTMQGRDLADAFSQITGEADHFSRREQRQLAAGTPAIRDQVNQETDGRWEDLCPKEQQEAVDRLSAEVVRRREK